MPSDQDKERISSQAIIRFLTDIRNGSDKVSHLPAMINKDSSITDHKKAIFYIFELAGEILRIMLLALHSKKITPSAITQYVVAKSSCFSRVTEDYASAIPGVPALCLPHARLGLVQSKYIIFCDRA